MVITQATINDVNDIVTLFAETIRSVNVKDYTNEEVEVWAAGAKNLNSWNNKIQEQTFYIARKEDLPVGFGSIAIDGYLDFMFVHKDFQRCGIAQSIMEKIEEKANQQNNDLIFAYVSITAKPFFQRMGFEQVDLKLTTMSGVTFESAKMIKSM